MPFEWTEEVEASFQTIKQMVSSSLVLKPFNPDLPTVLTSVASERGAGVILSQLYSDGSEHPVSYWSRSSPRLSSATQCLNGKPSGRCRQWSGGRFASGGDISLSGPTTPL